jgi:hypothetical protein
MTTRSRERVGTKRLAILAGLGAAACAGYVATTWWRYGRPTAGTPDEHDSLLDRFMPRYDVVDRHHVRIAAPAAVSLATARRMNLEASSVVRGIIAARERLLGATPNPRRQHDRFIQQQRDGFIADMQALGWGVLADEPDREIVVGAVTRPWQANVTFRALPPDQFAAFAEPGYVKIVWTLRADPIGTEASILRTETRAIATDDSARRRFRWYWSFLSPGIKAIRWAAFGPVKREAERSARIPSAR